ncbi:hypothetical protein pEaSNUABM10_00097 [Erwinia phage pEa_SNUABM_10]|nr:hypothetical protein pEaSNUABM10_00097 [Erwinia phage pEa_SNUABM_10]
MVKLLVIELNQYRDVLHRFELPDNVATTAFMERFRGTKTAIYGGRRWTVYYNVRGALTDALTAGKVKETTAFLKAYEKDPLAIGIMLAEKEQIGRPAQSDE